MRTNFIAPLLACAMAAGPCFAGTVEAPAQGNGFDLALVVEPEPLVLSSDVSPGRQTVPQVPAAAEVNSATDIGTSVDVTQLDQLRGGKSTVENNVLLDGTVEGNTADHVVSGSNSISDGAFSNASGINTVIQNTGSNVLIQNGMVVNVQFVAPVGP
ncbi:MAG: hypothetical protein ABI538_01475 [Pseudoxanthomonas sp.]